MIDLVRAGRTPRELAREFEPTYETIRNWARQADRDEGRTDSGLSTEERDELRRLRREIRQLRLEREILAKAAALRFRRPVCLHACLSHWDGRQATHRRRPTRGTTRVYEFVSAHQDQYPVSTMCCLLGVSTSGYYAWRKRGPSRRTQQDVILLKCPGRFIPGAEGPTGHPASMHNSKRTG